MVPDSLVDYRYLKIQQRHRYLTNQVKSRVKTHLYGPIGLETRSAVVLSILTRLP